MSSIHILLAELDKGKPAPRASYRNSGCGPREVFRTPELGRRIQFDIGEALARWEPTARDKTIRGALDVRRGARVRVEIIDRVTNVALEALSIRASDSSRRASTTAAGKATHNIEILATELQKRSGFSHLVGIAQAVAAPERDLSRISYDDKTEISPLDFATTLVAASVFAPPLLFWDRPPSFTWWRLDKIIALRIFARPQVDLFSSEEAI
ncbi:MAG: hypothetical protein ABI556_14180 [Gemmatimonadales bacterium]